LWILDQGSQPVATIDPKTGQVLANVVTEYIHGSSITYGDGAWFTAQGVSGNPSTLKVDPKTAERRRNGRRRLGHLRRLLTRERKPGDLPWNPAAMA
jgi:hypothetical protein